MDEILVKGQDGKWYILKGEELLPYDEGTQDLGTQVRGSDLPKGVKRETYERLEQKTDDRRQKTPHHPEAHSGGAGQAEIRPPSSVLRPPVSHEQHPLSKELEELVDKVLQEVTERLQEVTRSYLVDPVLAKRFRTIVSARLRDVRDANETRQMLMRPQKVGGMGIGKQLQEVTGGYNKSQEVDPVSDIIEKAFAEFQAKWKEAEEKKRAAWQKKQIQERAAREEQQAKQEQEELEERYRRMVGEKGAARQVATEAVGSTPLGTRSVTAGDKTISSTSPHSSSARPQSVLKESTQAGLRASSGSVSRLLPSASVAPFPKEEEKKQAVAAKQPEEEKKIALSPPPVQKTDDRKQRTPHHPEAHSGGAGQAEIRPPSAVRRTLPPGKVTDIRPAPKLVGPVEEIGSLRLEDFRRLPGPSASERAWKISEKIELLGRESLIRRSQGLEAWRHCPLNQLYGQILHTALQKRVSPQQVLTEWAGAGNTALTAEEFRAIMELNQKLRF